MKIYRVCKDRLHKNDMLHGLSGYLSSTDGYINLFGALIKSRTSSLLTPGIIFGKSCNINKFPEDIIKYLVFGYRDWECVETMYSIDEITWLYSEGYKIAEIDINPNDVIISDIDKYQCLFNRIKSKRINYLELKDVKDCYDEYKAENYVMVNLFDHYVDDALGLIKHLTYLDLNFILSFRCKNNTGYTDLSEYENKKILPVKVNSELWNELKLISEMDTSNSDKNIMYFENLYNKYEKFL